MSSIFKGDCEIGAGVVRTAAFMNKVYAESARARSMQTTRSPRARAPAPHVLSSPEVAEHHQIRIVDARTPDRDLLAIRRKGKNPDRKRLGIDMGKLSGLAAVERLDR